MKINWKVRLQSGPFWVGAISALLVFVYAFCNLIGVELPFEQSALMNVLLLFLTLLSAIGIISDPTTQGVQDSDRAMSYDEPGCSEGEE